MIGVYITETTNDQIRTCHMKFMDLDEEDTEQEERDGMVRTKFGDVICDSPCVYVGRIWRVFRGRGKSCCFHCLRAFCCIFPRHPKSNAPFSFSHLQALSISLER